MKNITTVMLFFIIALPLSGAIVLRSTIEVWEGSLEDAGWNLDTLGDGEIDKGVEIGILQVIKLKRMVN